MHQKLLGVYIGETWCRLRWHGHDERTGDDDMVKGRQVGGGGVSCSYRQAEEDLTEQSAVKHVHARVMEGCGKVEDEPSRPGDDDEDYTDAKMVGDEVMR